MRSHASRPSGVGQMRGSTAQGYWAQFTATPECPRALPRRVSSRAERNLRQVTFYSTWASRITELFRVAGSDEQQRAWNSFVNDADQVSLLTLISRGL